MSRQKVSTFIVQRIIIKLFLKKIETFRNCKLVKQAQFGDDTFP